MTRRLGAALRLGAVRLSCVVPGRFASAPKCVILHLSVRPESRAILERGGYGCLPDIGMVRELMIAAHTNLGCHPRSRSPKFEIRKIRAARLGASAHTPGLAPRQVSESSSYRAAHNALSIFLYVVASSRCLAVVEVRFSTISGVSITFQAFAGCRV